MVPKVMKKVKKYTKEQKMKKKSVNKVKEGRIKFEKTACRCSGKLFFQNNSFMHKFSQKRKTTPRCREKLFLGGPRGEKRVPKMEIMARSEKSAQERHEGVKTRQ